jgi:hypothetical protein
MPQEGNVQDAFHALLLLKILSAAAHSSKNASRSVIIGSVQSAALLGSETALRLSQPSGGSSGFAGLSNHLPFGTTFGSAGSASYAGVMI